MLFVKMYILLCAVIKIKTQIRPSILLQLLKQPFSTSYLITDFNPTPLSRYLVIDSKLILVNIYYFLSSLVLK